MKKTLRKNIADFNKLKILVVGDAILDAYIYGTTERICREAPVPVFKREQEKNCCGGAANTALNIASLGAEICFLTVLGDDENGRKIREILQQYKVDTSPVVIDKNRVTIAKKRIVASSSIILRMDEGSAFHIEKDTAKIFEDNFFAAARSADAVVISDYGFGTVTNDFINMLVTFRRQHSKLIIVDSKNLQRFQAVKPDAVKPNYEELLQLLKLEKVKKEDRAEQVIEAGNALLSLTGAKNIAATLDESGVVLLRKNRKPYFNAAVPKESKNTIGAGDTFISALTLSMGAGFEMEAAIEVASAAASIVVDREDTSLCSNLQLQAYFNPIPKYHSSRTELIQTLKELKNAGKKIVFTNGCLI